MKEYISDPALLDELNGDSNQKQYINDPALLAQLNGESTPATGRNYVSDPSLLAELEGSRSPTEGIQPEPPAQPQLSPYDTRYNDLMTEEEQHQAAMADYELALADYQAEQALPVMASHTLAEPVRPELSVRDLATIQSDYELGLQYLRESEFSQIVNDLEQGYYPGYEGRTLVKQLGSGLTPEAQSILQLAQLTGEELNKQRHISNQLTTDEDRKQDVFRRGFYNDLTFGYANAPDEDRLNSDDLQVAALERAEQLIRNEEATNHPLQNFLGEAVGTLLPFGAGVAGLRALRVARGLTPVGAGATGAVVEGAAVGGPLGFLRRPEGAESMSPGENVQARLQNALIEVGAGAVFDASAVKAGEGLVKMSQWLKAAPKLAKDKQIRNQARKAGYDDPEDFISDLVEVIQTDEGAFVKPKKEIFDEPSQPKNTEESETLSTEQVSAQTAETVDSPESGSKVPVTDPLSGVQASGSVSSATPASPMSRVTTIRGTPVDIEYRVVEAEDLITSHQENGIENPDYPSALQPRDRGRGASEAQLRKLAATLRPEWLSASPKASDGAPIVGPDGVVESGNGRVSALRYAYQGEKGAEYRNWLEGNAGFYGMDQQQIAGMKQPVLVRVRKTPMNELQRAQFTREANQSDIARLSPTEQARMDAELLQDEDILMYAPDSDGGMSNTENHAFLRAFVDRVGEMEAGSMIDSQGRPNADMVKRVQAAVFSKAYDDDRLITLFAEEADPDVRNLLNALNTASPAFARARSMDQALGGSDVNIVTNLMDAVDIIRTSRRDRQAVSEILDQKSLLQETEEVTGQLARFLDNNMRSPRRMGEALKELGLQLENHVIKGGDDLFGASTVSKSDFIDSTNRTLRGRHGEAAQTIPTKNNPSQPFRKEEGASLRTDDKAGRGAGEQVGAGRRAAVAESTPVSDGEARVYLKTGDSGDGLEVMGRSVRHVKTSRLPTGKKVISEPSDMAHITAPFRKDAQESFITVVTDDNGEVLRVAKMFTGDRDNTMVNPGAVAGLISNTPGAKKAWFAHNHPSGNVSQSPMDRDLTAQLHDLLDGTGIEAQGSVVIGPSNKYSYYHPTNRQGEFGNEMAADQLDIDGEIEAPIPAYGRRESLDLTERKLTGKSTDQPPVLSGDDLERYFTTNDQQKEGVVLLDNQARPVGFLSLSKDEMRSLRTGESGGSRQLLSAIDQTNASYIGARVDSAQNSEVSQIAGNLNGFSQQANVRLVDVVDGQGKALGTRQDIPSQSTFYANPVGVAFREVGKELGLEGGFSAAAGGVYGGVSSDQETFSGTWWQDVMEGAAMGGAASWGLRKAKVIGVDSITGRYFEKLGKALDELPLIGRGNAEVRDLKKKQQLMKQVIDRQTEQVGKVLMESFTPSERAIMADLIENRGIIKDYNLIHKQAHELDEFITFTSDRMKKLGMLPAELETGGYLHRYYAKHLKLLKNPLKTSPKKQSLSGSWSARRGTDDTFSQEFMSTRGRQLLKEHADLTEQINKLEKKLGDLINPETRGKLGELKEQRDSIEAIKFREYLGVQDGKTRSFIFTSDEVPKVPGIEEPKTATQLDGNKDWFRKMKKQPVRQNGLTDTGRSWHMRGQVKDKGLFWRDWTKEERTSWGEIEDAGYRFVRGQAEVAHDLSMATMFDRAARNSDWVSSSPKVVDGKEWVHVPDSKVNKNSPLKKYGALSGQYVRPDIWAALRHHGRAPFGNSLPVQVYRGAVNRWKLWKTVYNPVTHFNNTFSNTEMYYLSGYEAKYLANALKELNQGENSEIWKEARDAGLFGSDWGSSIVKNAEGGTNSVLDDLAEKLRNQPEIPDAIETTDQVMRFKEWFIKTRNAVKGADTRLGSGLELGKAVAAPASQFFRKPVHAMARSAQNLYRLEDEFFKLAVYMSERNKGKAPLAAVQDANRFFFDYNDLPKAVKIARDLPIGSPFISYTWLAVPAMIRNAIERPERLFMLAAAYEGINFAGMSVNDDLQPGEYWQRVEDENALYPNWMKGRTMFGANNSISIPFLEGYKLSLANAHALGNPFLGEASNRAGSVPPALAAWGSDWLGSNPLHVLYDIAWNENWKGREIVSPEASVQEKVSAYTNYMYQSWGPSNILTPGSYHQQKIIEGLANNVAEAKARGEEPNSIAATIVDIANVTASALGGGQFTGVDGMDNPILTRDSALASVGIKLRPVRTEQFYQFEISDLVKRQQQVNKDYRSASLKHSEGRITTEQYQRAGEHHEKRTAEISEKMTKLNEAEQRLR
ncbi:hypothetical protein NX722_23435 [Endozoicomonas gorgoniicola]|uniref:MPN domain-containing protein n=1 Tax=Endozoicomonas gorgoniicola TaxID=1234144 RepID=A0ABT3N1K7_9GAMM|nr:JAB domain-containing protein [Endozoicomonas gorgoniicola]MCW7555520.1 hypothetical protein [Endozoicomonas gorgoniicola]